MLVKAGKSCDYTVLQVLVAKVLAELDPSHGQFTPLLEMQVIAPLLIGSHGSNMWSVSRTARLQGQVSSPPHVASYLYPQVTSHLALGMQGKSPWQAELTHLSWSGSPG